MPHTTTELSLDLSSTQATSTQANVNITNFPGERAATYQQKDDPAIAK
jgi:hypothetical protein